jgi:hypothetical protein
MNPLVKLVALISFPRPTSRERLQRLTLLALNHYSVAGDGAGVSDKILARLGISYMFS